MKEKLTIVFAKFLTILANGKRIMWFYTMNMIVLSWWATVKGKAIDSSVAIMYGSALTAYVGSKGFEYYQQSKTTVKQEAGDV